MVQAEGEGAEIQADDTELSGCRTSSLKYTVNRVMRHTKSLQVQPISS
jgi:hypothetical protein